MQQHSVYGEKYIKALVNVTKSKLVQSFSHIGILLAFGYIADRQD